MNHRVGLAPTVVGSLVVIYLAWGANFVAVHIAVAHVSPAAMMGTRFTTAGALLLPIGRRLGLPAADQPAAWRDASRTAVTLFAGGSGLLAWGQTYLDSGVAAILIATVPLWLIGLDLGTRQLRPTGRIGLALVAGTIGVATTSRVERQCRVGRSARSPGTSEAARAHASDPGA